MLEIEFLKFNAHLFIYLSISTNKANASSAKGEIILKYLFSYHLLI